MSRTILETGRFLVPIKAGGLEFGKQCRQRRLAINNWAKPGTMAAKGGYQWPVTLSGVEGRANNRAQAGALPQLKKLGLSQFPFYIHTA